MNKLILTLSVIFFSVFVATAQSNNAGFDDNNQAATPNVTPRPEIKKGYYSIYNNSQKLNRSKVITSVKPKDQLLLSQTHAKGYYSIGDNHADVHKHGKSFIAITPRRPVAHKGYYSVKRPNMQPVQYANPDEAAKVNKAVLGKDSLNSLEN